MPQDEASEGEQALIECVSRLATEAELPALAIFERELARSSFPEDPILDLEYHEEKLRRALRQEPQGMIVQTVQGEIASWLWLSTRRTLATGEQYGLIRSIYVRKRYRGRGLALGLADYALRYFAGQGVTKIIAKVHVDNQPGMQVLRHIGFEPLHVTLQYRMTAGNGE